MTVSIQKQKAKLREEIKKSRFRISEDTYLSQSNNIERLALKFIENQNAKVVHSFISINERNEVNTHGLIKQLIEKGLTVIVPLMNGDFLEHSILESFLDLEPNSFGILEPNSRYHSDLKKIDIIFVPLLCIDQFGNRLGYGKGYYDRFLETTEALKIGLLFEEFVLDEIPTEDHDIKLDGFITENGVRLL